jgi:hypothetical protein
MVLKLPSQITDDEQLAGTDLPPVNQFLDDDAPLLERGAIGSLQPKQLPQKIVNNLSAFLAPEHLAGPLKFLYRPIFFGAIGLHALLLFSGGGKHEEKKEVKDKEKPATITQIATGKAAPKKAKKLASIALKKTPLAKLSNPLSSQAPVIKGPPKPEDSKVTQDSEVPKDGKTPDPQDGKTPDPQTANSKTLPDLKPDTTLPPPGAGAKKGSAFENFNIVYDGAIQAGTFYRAGGADIAAVEAFFKGQSGFSVKEAAGSSATRKILEISKDGQTGYIGLFPNGAETVYTSLRPSAADIPADIGTLKGEKALPPGYSDAFAAIAGSALGSPAMDDFTDPSQYMVQGETTTTADGLRQTPEPENAPGVSDLYILDTLSPQVVGESIKSQLSGLFKAFVLEPGGFNGGDLYRMTSDSGEYFLNVLPSANGSSTIVATFSKDPRS